MTDSQLYLAIGVPVVMNAAMFLLFSMMINKRLDDRFADVDRRFQEVNRRFDDMRDLWRSELHRVEEVLDTRLRHLEGQLG